MYKCVLISKPVPVFSEQLLASVFSKEFFPAPFLFLLLFSFHPRSHVFSLVAL